jgi:two-component system nitrate/nitrite response regulator NarL
MLSIRVLVASRVRLYREELARALRGSPEFTLIGSAASAEEAIKRTQELGADVVLLDMAMSGAFSVAKEVVRRRGPGKIVALGMPESEAQVVSCAQQGISAYVM